MTNIINIFFTSSNWWYSAINDYSLFNFYLEFGLSVYLHLLFHLLLSKKNLLCIIWNVIPRLYLFILIHCFWFDRHSCFLVIIITCLCFHRFRDTTQSKQQYSIVVIYLISQEKPNIFNCVSNLYYLKKFQWENKKWATNNSKLIPLYYFKDKKKIMKESASKRL